MPQSIVQTKEFQVKFIAKNYPEAISRIQTGQPFCLVAISEDTQKLMDEFATTGQGLPTIEDDYAGISYVTMMRKAVHPAVFTPVDHFIAQMEQTWPEADWEWQTHFAYYQIPGLHTDKQGEKAVRFAFSSGGSTSAYLAEEEFKTHFESLNFDDYAQEVKIYKDSPPPPVIADELYVEVASQDSYSLVFNADSAWHSSPYINMVAPNSDTTALKVMKAILSNAKHITKEAKAEINQKTPRVLLLGQATPSA